MMTLVSQRKRKVTAEDVHIALPNFVNMTNIGFWHVEPCFRGD